MKNNLCKINSIFLINKKVENFIYCCGKSGSSTLYKTLDNSYHTHTFLYFLRVNIKNNTFYDPKISYDLFDIIDENMERFNTKHVFFYDVYRTPFERKMSGFFQFLYHIDISSLINYIKKNDYLYSFDIMKINKYNFYECMDKNINWLIEIFWWISMINIDNYYSFLEYRNIQNFNIQNKKYFYQDNDKYKYIILKFDNIDEWDKILSHIHKRNIEIKKANIDLGFNKLYKKFKENFTIPSVLLKVIFYKDFKQHKSYNICNHYKVMKKFYTKEKIDNYIEYWNKRSNNIIPSDLYDDNIGASEIINNIFNFFKKNPRLKI